MQSTTVRTKSVWRRGLGSRPYVPSDYRPALDGVRAVAVLAVLAYHTDMGLSGGFLGVDVFFVLSGYLITSLLLREKLRTGGIRLTRFWFHRARRLLPALLLLLGIAALITNESAPMSTLAARRDDMFSSLFYFANWHFIDSAQSYFAAYAGMSPLRHTWSLAIEEQFYLLWPLALIAFMFASRAWQRVLPWLLLAGGAVSAVLMAVRYDGANPIRSYYGTDTRIHALLIGAALAAFAQLCPETFAGPRARKIAAVSMPVTGAAVLLAFFTLGDEDTFYYRGGSLAFALMVAIGLWALEVAPRGRPARGLSVSPVRWIGRISYGVYLWHWPLIVWIATSERFGSWTAGDQRLLVIALTFAIATASFYFVERPIRYGQTPWRWARGWRFAVIVIASTALVTVGIMQATQYRPPPELTELVSDSAPPIADQLNDKSVVECTPEFTAGKYNACTRTFPLTFDSLVVAVAGDSTSLALYPGIYHLAKQEGWQYIQAGQNGCSLTPLVFVGSTTTDEFWTKANCPHDVPKLMSLVTEKYHPDVWVVTDWIASAQLVVDSDTVLAPTNKKRVPIIASATRKMLSDLTADGAEVVYVESLPAAQPIECATKDKPATCNEPWHSLDDPATKLLNKIVKKAAKDLPGVVVVSVGDILCADRGRCPPIVDGLLARYDGVHYTSTFSRIIMPEIVARARKAGVLFDDELPPTPSTQPVTSDPAVP